MASSVRLAASAPIAIAHGQRGCGAEAGLARSEPPRRRLQVATERKALSVTSRGGAFSGATAVGEAATAASTATTAAAVSDASQGVSEVGSGLVVVSEKEAAISGSGSEDEKVVVKSAKQEEMVRTEMSVAEVKPRSLEKKKAKESAANKMTKPKAGKNVFEGLFSDSDDDEEEQTKDEKVVAAVVAPSPRSESSEEDKDGWSSVKKGRRGGTKAKKPSQNASAVATTTTLPGVRNDRNEQLDFNSVSFQDGNDEDQDNSITDLYFENRGRRPRSSRGSSGNKAGGHKAVEKRTLAIAKRSNQRAGGGSSSPGL